MVVFIFYSSFFSLGFVANAISYGVKCDYCCFLLLLLVLKNRDDCVCGLRLSINSSHGC